MRPIPSENLINFSGPPRVAEYFFFFVSFSNSNSLSVSHAWLLSCVFGPRPHVFQTPRVPEIDSKLYVFEEINAKRRKTRVLRRRGMSWWLNSGRDYAAWNGERRGVEKIIRRRGKEKTPSETVRNDRNENHQSENRRRPVEIRRARNPSFSLLYTRARWFLFGRPGAVTAVNATTIHPTDLSSCPEPKKKKKGGKNGEEKKKKRKKIIRPRTCGYVGWRRCGTGKNEKLSNAMSAGPVKYTAAAHTRNAGVRVYCTASGTFIRK